MYESSELSRRWVVLMRTFLRSFLALLIAGLVVGAPSMASAVTDPSPSPGYGCLVDEGAAVADGEGDYSPPLPCELRVVTKSPICDNDVPKLRYAVEAIGSPNTTVTITWVNPSGADVVQSDLPLSGTVLWPGAVEENGVGVDWPGWRQLADGTWVEGDEFDWVRPSVQVKFQVNPEATVTVAYPPSSPQCLTNPPGSSVLAAEPPVPSAVLSATGSNALPVALVGGGLVLAGAAALAATMRHRRRVQQP